MYQNPFAPKEAQTATKIYYEQGSPVTMKADCKNGLFLEIGQEAEVMGEGGRPVKNPMGLEKIRMHVLKYYNIPKSTLFPNETSEPKAHERTQIFYVHEGALYATLLKGESRDRFLAAVRSVAVRSGGLKNFTQLYFDAAMCTRRSEAHKTNYFAVEFTAETEVESETMAEATAFGLENYDAIYCLRTVTEFINRNLPNAVGKDPDVVIGQVLYHIGAIPTTDAPVLRPFALPE